MLARWKKVYDRGTVLDKADRARGRGNVRKAIRGYTTILQHEPGDHQVHARVAPLFAKTRRWQEARKSFDAAGEGYLKQGFADKAIAVWTTAAQHLPEDVEYWERIANEQLRRGRRADAVNAHLHDRLLQVALVGLHLHFAQRQILQVRARFSGKHGALLAGGLAVQQPPSGAAHGEQHHADHD